MSGVGPPYRCERGIRIVQTHEISLQPVLGANRPLLDTLLHMPSIDPASPDFARRPVAAVADRPAGADPAPLEPDRHLRLAGTRNLRDVGGYATVDGRVTRWRTLLRTDAFDQLPAESQEALLDLGLRTVIDLRWPHELEEAPSVFARSDRVSYRSISLLGADPTPEIGLAGTYRHVFDERASQLTEVVRAILDDGPPAVIGCAAGKDRTGVAIAAILRAVGVPIDTIAVDYALSGEIFAGPAEHAGLDGWRGEPVVVDCDPAWMIAALEHLDRQHGGARALLVRNGLTDADLDRLVDELTEPAS